MNKKISLLLCLIFCFILLGGCETTKGAATGVGATAMGVAKDTKNFWQAILKADEWIKENLW